MAKKLYRSLDDRKIAGICGGLGEYFDIDPTIVRLLWVSMVLAVGTGILAYILAWIIVPEEPIATVVEETNHV
ncbi:MAG: PspC domain-containing protein [candidate division Zixibacteria bacterium]|nr:PspC domain-containing protein [candidate division Zixibacteria bacterium]